MTGAKSQIRNSKKMEQGRNKKEYNLEARTLAFARAVRVFIKKIPRTISSIEDGKQVIRSSGSMGANYIEANESLGNKDFLMKIKISRKESKETRYWLELIISELEPELNAQCKILIQEATELMMIFSSILRKSV